ncbi:MAG: hypothetical protein WBB26_12570, partial [Saprospiraceae bacterium]
MNNFKFDKFILIILTIASICFSSCNSGPGIKGNISDGGSSPITLERIGLDNNATVIDQQEMKNGAFSFNFKEQPKAGLYRIKFAQQNIIILLDGTEKNIELSGNLASLQNASYVVKGSAPTEEMLSSFQKFTSGGQPNMDDIKSTITNAKSPLAASLLAVQLLGFRPEFLGMHRDVAARLKSSYPDSELTKSYESFIVQTEQAQKQQQAEEV